MNLFQLVLVAASAQLTFGDNDFVEQDIHPLTARRADAERIPFHDHLYERGAFAVLEAEAESSPELELQSQMNPDFVRKFSSISTLSVYTSMSNTNLSFDS